MFSFLLVSMPNITITFKGGKGYTIAEKINIVLTQGVFFKFVFRKRKNILLIMF